ncbi:MAG: hypothetical protein HYZ40_06975 [Rhodospirillales bacterium]|nr:hypothetical protein [Rhodospirillales bacterium]
MIEPLLHVATASVAARSLRAAAEDAKTRFVLTVCLYAAAGAGVFCLGRAALVVLERHFDPAESWAILGGLYGLLAGAFYYLMAEHRRRPPTGRR